MDWINPSRAARLAGKKNYLFIATREYKPITLEIFYLRDYNVFLKDESKTNNKE